MHAGSVIDFARLQLPAIEVGADHSEGLIVMARQFHTRWLSVVNGRRVTGEGRIPTSAGIFCDFHSRAGGAIRFPRALPNGDEDLVSHFLTNFCTLPVS